MSRTMAVPFNGNSYCPRCAAYLAPVPDDGFEQIPSQRTIGVELEHIAANDCDVSPWGQFKTDGSVRCDDDHGYNREFVSKVSRGDAHAKLVKAACTEMVMVGDGIVNNSCGFHCHIGVADLSGEQRQNLRTWWRGMERTFYGLVKRTRQANQFCRPIQGATSSDVRWDEGRYYGLNISALREHGTYEFRLHHGTLDHRRITAWSTLLTQWVDTFCDITPTQDRVSSYLNTTDKARLIFLCERAKLPSFVQRDVYRRARLYRALDISSEGPAVNV